MYVLHWADQDQIHVFSTPDFVLRRRLSLPAKKDDLRDMTSCAVENCLYVSNWGEQCLHKIKVEQLPQSKWTVKKRPNGLSVMEANCHVLVTCRDDRFLIQLNRQGRMMRMFQLPEDVMYPLHALQMPNGAYLVSHGDLYNPEHRVCKLVGNDKVMEVVGSYGSQKGSGQDQLNEPCHMALSRHGFVFVADFSNGRVVLLNPSLKFVRNLFTETKGSRAEIACFQRLYLDSELQKLYVGDFSGNVTILRLLWSH